jgi:murein L,D-transpeptidase YafK
MFRCGCRIGATSVFDVYNCLRGKLMNTFHALGDIGLKEVVTRNTASALSALFVTIQILLLSASPTAAISVDLAKKCRDMAIKAHPRAMPGKPYAQAERDFFRQCVAKNGQMEYTDAASVLYEPKTTVRTEDVRTSTLLQMETLNMDRGAPILIRIYKEENTLEVWKRDRTGKFALLSAYPICKYSGHLGPKIFEGDHQAPEGFYDITPDQMKSDRYLAFDIGFPNAFDRSLGRTGSFLMVHGGCKSVGCYAMTDYAMDEIYGLADEAFGAGQEKVQLEAFPFRMTTQNLARHTDDPNMPFWQMLKTGSDAFLTTGRPPTVAACDQHYVFNAAITDKDCDPAKEKATHIASHVPRWGVWLAADLEESRAWAIYRERQKRFASLIGNREPIVLLRQIPGMGRAKRYVVTIADDDRAPLDQLCKKLSAASATCDVLRNNRGD